MGYNHKDVSLILKELIFYLFISKNGYVEIQFTHHNIHSFKVYSPMVFSIVTEMCNHQDSLLSTLH